MGKHQIGRVPSTETRSVRLDAVDQADKLAHEFDLPFLAEFLSDIAVRHASDSEAEGRRYQQEIVEHGELEVVSPYTGKPAKSAVSFLVLRSIFYRFSDQPEFYVAAARTILGNPLIGLFVPREKLLLTWEFGDHKPSVSQKHIVELETIMSRSNIRIAPSHRPVTVLIGHQNFAHHLLNELPALERLLTIVQPRNAPELLVRREPLGPLGSIFPELSQWKISRIDWRIPPWCIPPSINDDGRLFVKPGSYRMPSALRMRIRRFAENAASAATVNLISTLRQVSAPTFWISVRTQEPTMTNQVDTLATLAARLFREFERCVILFDGFSLPDDWLQCDPDTMEFYNASVESSKKEINTIIDKVHEISPPGPQQLLVNAGGFGILDSIALAQTANCYLCHAGTVQHKVGWTTDKRGIIHTSRNKIVKKNKTWYHPDWLEDAILPIPVPYTLVGNYEENGCYTVVDPAEFAEFVVRRFGCYAGNAGERR